MKNSFKLLSLCAALALVCGCEKPTSSASETPTNTATPTVTETQVPQPKTLNLLDKVVDGGDEIYTVSKQGNDVKLDYTKAEKKEWSNAKVDLTDVDMSKMKTLRFSLKGEGKVLLKFQSDAGALEVNIRPSADFGAYEWTMGTEDAKVLAEPVNFYIFGLPGASSGSGTITFNQLEFTEEEADNYIITTGFTNIVATANEYDGTSATFDINHYWMQNDENSYTFEEVEGGIKVSYSQADYQYAYSTLQGDNYGKFNYITIKAKGTAGEKVMFKVEPTGLAAKEMTFTFTGEDDVFSMDLSSYDSAGILAIKRVLMFAAPGEKNVKGNFVLQSVYFTTTNEGTVIPPTPVENLLNYDGYGRFLDIDPNKFNALDEGVYTVVDKEFTYNKGAGQEYSATVLNLTGAIGDFTTLDFDVTLAAEKSIMIKLEGCNKAIETTINATRTGSINLLEENSRESLNLVNKIVIFAELGTAPASGTFKINSLKFAGRVPSVVKTDGSVDLATGMLFDLGDKAYDITQNADKTYTVVSKENKGDWSCFGIRITTPEIAYKSVTVTLSGSTTNTVLVKMENDTNAGINKETNGALGEHVTFTLDITNIISSNPDTLLLVFFVNQARSGAAENVTIESITFSV